MKLSHYKKANLDARYTSYDPDQELENNDSEVHLCCPFHGPYKVPSKYLTQMYLKRTLRSAKCKDCFDEKLSDREYLFQVGLFLTYYRRNQIHLLADPPHPEWKPLDHWASPNLMI